MVDRGEQCLHKHIWVIDKPGLNGFRFQMFSTRMCSGFFIVMFMYSCHWSRKSTHSNWKQLCPSFLHWTVHNIYSNFNKSLFVFVEFGASIYEEIFAYTFVTNGFSDWMLCPQKFQKSYNLFNFHAFQTNPPDILLAQKQPLLIDVRRCANISGTSKIRFYQNARSDNVLHRYWKAFRHRLCLLTYHIYFSCLFSTQ